MVTGPRRCGKATLLRHLAGVARRFVSLDDLELRRLATSEPRLFVEQFRPPVVIDEFQYAPDILPYIKMEVDALRTTGRSREAAGMYWLTGSQHFGLMKNVRESLSGRVAILDLLGFSPYERLEPTTPIVRPVLEQDFRVLAGHDLLARSYRAPVQVFAEILRGTMPQVVARARAGPARSARCPAIRELGRLERRAQLSPQGPTGGPLLLADAHGTGNRPMARESGKHHGSRNPHVAEVRRHALRAASPDRPLAVSVRPPGAVDAVARPCGDRAWNVEHPGALHQLSRPRRGGDPGSPPAPARKPIAARVRGAHATMLPDDLVRRSDGVLARGC